MRKLDAPHCYKHPYNTLPCLACQRLAQLYRAPEVEQKRVRAVQAFTSENEGIEGIPEAWSVFSALGVTDREIQDAIRGLNEMVWRLAPYPDYYPKRRKLAAKARDFLEKLCN